MQLIGLRKKRKDTDDYYKNFTLMNNYDVLSALAMDLKRVSLGIQRGSFRMAERFSEEALKRKDEVDTDKLKPYVQRVLKHLPRVLSTQSEQTAEDALMYSTILQNYCITFLSKKL